MHQYLEYEQLQFDQPEGNVAGVVQSQPPLAMQETIGYPHAVVVLKVEKFHVSFAW